MILVQRRMLQDQFCCRRSAAGYDRSIRFGLRPGNAAHGWIFCDKLLILLAEKLLQLGKLSNENNGEQLTLNQRVLGSSPSASTTFLRFLDQLSDNAQARHARRVSTHRHVAPLVYNHIAM